MKTRETNAKNPAHLDPVKYGIFFNKLDEAVNDSREVLKYLSGSVIVKEAGEALVAFYLPDGHAVDIATGLLMHFMNVTRCIQYMNQERYAEEGVGIYDGDQFMNNEAFIAGMHCPDTGCIAPVFYDGELQGYVAAVSHTTETGGIEPGGMCPSAVEAWHDGFHVPAIKIVERGTTRRDVWNMLLRSTRDPRTLELDLRARIAANERARQRILEIIDEVGVEFFQAACNRLVEEGNEFFQAKLGRLRPGIYKARIYSDTLGGIQAPKLAVEEVAMEITPDRRMIVKVPVVSPQQRCFNNAYLPAVEATLYYSLLTQLVYDGRWNSGMAKSIEIDVPSCSRLNADPTVSVGYATIGIAMNFCSMVTDCLSRAYYAAGIDEEVQAPPAGNLNCSINAGVDAAGMPFANILLSACLAVGGGGRTESDGFCNYHFYNPWQEVPDTEAEERLARVLHLCRSFMPDTGGHGKYRGGSAVVAITAQHGVAAAYPCSMGTGSRLPANQGIFGGYPSNVGYVSHLLNTNLYELTKQGILPLTDPSDFSEITKHVAGDFRRFETSAPTIPMKEGDIWTELSNGGGGLGDPLERDPELIVEDIKTKQATLRMAERVYHVSIDPQTLEIDYEKTEQLREETRKRRLSRGMEGKEYLKALVAKRESRSLPEPVLDYMDEISQFSPAFAEQLKAEEALLEKSLEPIKTAKVRQRLFKLTPYLDVVEDTGGNNIIVCSRCGFAYCDAGENFKYYSLIYDRDPAVFSPPALAMDKDFGIYREFYCPGCGCQTEVELTPEGTPILNSYENLSVNWKADGAS